MTIKDETEMLSLIAATLLFQSAGNTDLPPARQSVRQPPQTVMICRREREVGSNRTRRVCATEEQRDNARRSAERNIEMMGDRAGPDGEVRNSHNQP